jgi:Tol biopolymer transport system component
MNYRTIAVFCAGLATAWFALVAVPVRAGELAGYKFLVTSVRTGNTEVFVVDADGTNLRQLTHLGKIATPAAWSADGRWISFRLTDERYWGDPARMKNVYREKPGDKRPVWVIRPDGSGAHVVEPLRYQCAMDGSRAAWRPLVSPARSAIDEKR